MRMIIYRRTVIVVVDVFSVTSKCVNSDVYRHHCYTTLHKATESGKATYIYRHYIIVYRYVRTRKGENGERERKRYTQNKNIKI